MLLAVPLCSCPLPLATDEQSDPERDHLDEVVSANAEKRQLIGNLDSQDVLEMKPVFEWADPAIPEGQNLYELHFTEDRQLASWTR